MSNRAPCGRLQQVPWRGGGGEGVRRALVLRPSSIGGEGEAAVGKFLHHSTVAVVAQVIFFFCGTTFRFTDSNPERNRNFFFVFPLTNQSNLFREGESGGGFFCSVHSSSLRAETPTEMLSLPLLLLLLLFPTERDKERKEERALFFAAFHVCA